MNKSCRVIHVSFAPTISARDALHAGSLLARPSQWRTGPAPERLARALENYLGPTAVQPMLGAGVQTVDSARNALRLALQALGVRPGDEVLLQAFTCVSVPGPVLWLRARPVYVDIDPATYNMDPADFRRKITPRTKALIIQHTFGLPADLAELLDIAREHNLAVIEDCAHALGATYRGRPVGTFGDAAIFSFGRDKVISAVFGGAVFANTARARAGLRRLPASPLPPPWWVAKQLLHTAAAPLLRQSYFCGGRHALRAALKLRLLSKAITPWETRGGVPPLAPSRLANALALRALDQLGRLDEFLEQRRRLAQHYGESLKDLPQITLPLTPPDRTHGFLRYPVRVVDRAAIHQAARRAGIILQEAWYNTVIAPRSTDLAALRYTAGSCPCAEEAAQRVVNLPTSPTLSITDADRVLRVVRDTLVSPR